MNDQSADGMIAFIFSLVCFLVASYGMHFVYNWLGW